MVATSDAPLASICSMLFSGESFGNSGRERELCREGWNSFLHETLVYWYVVPVHHIGAICSIACQTGTWFD